MNASFLALPLWFIPACTAGSGVLIAAIKMRPANKAADNDAARVKYEAATTAQAVSDAQWSRLQEEISRQDAKLKTYDERIAELEREVTECHRERDSALAEVARLEAIQLGMGVGRQRAAETVAADRLEQRAKDAK